jgi:hypothetical protein
VSYLYVLPGASSTKIRNFPTFPRDSAAWRKCRPGNRFGCTIISVTAKAADYHHARFTINMLFSLLSLQFHGVCAERDISSVDWQNGWVYPLNL